MSDCGVCIGMDYGDCDGTAEFSRVWYPKAKKPHKCGECNRPIAVGETYQRFKCLFDGGFDDEKTCTQCAEIREGFSCEAWPMWGELWNEMREYVFPQMNSSCFEKLSTPEAKEFLRKRWMEWKGLAIAREAKDA